MKNFTKKLLLWIGMVVPAAAMAQVAGDYRTGGTAVNWSSGPWETYNGTTWGSTATPPGAANSVYIEAGHTVTVDVATVACNDLHVSTTGVIAAGTNIVTVNGKLRCYTGAAPGTNNATPGTACITTTAPGKMVFTFPGAITVAGEWGANTTPWKAEFAITGGGTATLATNFKAGDIVITSGTVSTNSDIRPDAGTANTGTLIVNAGAVLRFTAGAHIRRTGTAGTTCSSVTVNGTLDYTGTVGTLFAVSTSLPGIVSYTGGAQTLSANISQYNQLVLGGTGIKSNTLPISISGSVTISGSSTCVLTNSTGSVTYGTGATLIMSSSSSFYDYDGAGTNNMWPAVNGPSNLSVTTNTVRINNATTDRTISGALTLNGGTLTVRDLAVLRFANNASIVRTNGALNTSSTGAGNGIINHGLVAGDKVNLVINNTAASGAEFPTNSLITPGGIGTITINNGAEYSLSNGNRTVTNIIFNSGKIIQANNNFSVSNSISGASSSNYVVTSTAAAGLQMNVAALPVLFPVGPSNTLYHPATITNNGTADNYTVNVVSAFPGCAANSGDKWVNATWNITEAVAGGSDCTLSLDYSGATGNGAGYSASQAQVGHCNGTTLDYYSGSVTGSVATGAGFTSFSPFGVTNEAAILPLQLISFSVTEVSKTSMLKWITVNEINVKGFYIQRSVNGVNFTDINFVKSGNGNYIYTDNAPLKGRNYYRLKMVDNDGRTAYSDIVSIRIDDFAGMLVFPTVTENKLTLDGLNGIAAPYDIFNTSGQRMQTGKVGAGNRDISVVLLPAGTYILKVNGQAIKFVKQ